MGRTATNQGRRKKDRIVSDESPLLLRRVLCCAADAEWQLTAPLLFVQRPNDIGQVPGINWPRRRRRRVHRIHSSIQYEREVARSAKKAKTGRAVTLALSDRSGPGPGAGARTDPQVMTGTYPGGHRPHLHQEQHQHRLAPGRCGSTDAVSSSSSRAKSLPHLIPTDKKRHDHCGVGWPSVRRVRQRRQLLVRRNTVGGEQGGLFLYDDDDDDAVLKGAM
jgi:hypothetical protein